MANNKLLDTTKSRQGDYLRTKFLVRLTTKTIEHQLSWKAADYVGSLVPMTFRCREHGKFQATPKAVVYKPIPCPECRAQVPFRGERQRQEALAILKEKIKASGCTFVSSGDSREVTYKCPTHGVVTAKHRASCAFVCHKCKHEINKANNSIVQAGKAAFYQEVKRRKVKVLGEYVRNTLPVAFFCETHGEFQITPAAFKSGRGCQHCGFERRDTAQKKSDKEYRGDLKDLHGDKFSLVGEYKGSDKFHTYRCTKCDHEWQTRAYVTMSPKQHGCPQCTSGRVSKAESEIYQLVKSWFPDAKNNHRWPNNGSWESYLEVDIFIPSKHLAIEYNGLYWHSFNLNGNKHKHYDKWQACASLGIRLIQIYEDQWLTQKKLVIKTLKHTLGLTTTKYAARDCMVKHTTDIAKVRQFYDRNHLQGCPRSGTTYSLFHEGKRVAAMTFSPPVSHRGLQEAGTVELIRFATVGSVIGGASRLFSNYLSAHPRIKKIISYSDNDWFNGRLYEVLGFTKSKDVSPQYTTVWGKIRHHKSYTKRANLQKLLGRSFDPNISEMQNLLNNQIPVVFDSGKQKWEYKVRKT